MDPSGPDERTRSDFPAAEIGDAGLPSLVASRYRILECIGEGGMGIVCRGFDLELEEVLAVKFLRAELAEDPAVCARFRSEVKLARRVTHPHVARVFEFGRDGALSFLTMEFIPGESLHALLLREGPLPLSQVLHLAVHTCEGLAAAHDAGVVHGDMKPGNVLVAPVRGAVITDFGIAQAFNEPRRSDGSASGTPLYMAPEQARGEPMAPHTDVYAIGVLLLEALTGADLWPEHDAMGLLASKRCGIPPDLARIAPHLPDAWSQLIADCLRNDPGGRPADASALLARLTGISGAAARSTAPVGPPAPLAGGSGDGDGPCWIAVDSLVSPEELSWISAELTRALGQIRSLRVLAGTSDAVAPAARITGRAMPSAGGVTVHLTLQFDGHARDLSLTQPRASLHQLGAELAARIAVALDRTATHPRRDVLDPEVSEFYVQARHAYLSMHIERSLRLFDAALARAPGHRLLKLEATLARVQAAFMFREASSAEISELRGAIDEAVLLHDDLGESHLARARIALALGDTATTARSLCAAISRAPSLVEAYNLLADLLIDIGRLPDAARRLDISLALDRSAIHAWSCRARLLAYNGEWDAFHTLVADTLPILEFRALLIAPLMLWNPRQESFTALDRMLERNHDTLPPQVAEAARLVVDFALRRCEPYRILDRLDVLAVGSTHMRRNGFVAQLSCELACLLGDIPRALGYLDRADRWLFIDWQWIEHCPTLVGLRADPTFARVRDSVRARADAVAEAVWG